MDRSYLTFESVSFEYPGSPSPILEDVSFSIGPGWTSFAGANGCGKTTLLKLGCGLLQPDSGKVMASGRSLYCMQRTDDPPEGFSEFVRAWRHAELMAKLGIGWDWPERWRSLSHGERKRAQLAMALAAAPDILAVDEPVNHLDTSARRMIREALSAYRGTGLLVSHDRELLDTLSARCGLMHGGGLVIRKGGYSVASREDGREQTALRESRTMARDKYRQLKRDARRKQLRARTLQARSCGRRVTYRDICLTGADGPSRIDGVVQKAGQLSRTAQARMERAREEMESTRFRKEYRRGIEFPGEQSFRNSLIELPEGNIRIGSLDLYHPGLCLLSEDRISLTGPNGSGKSTLIEKLVNSADLPRGRLLYIPQELTGEQSREVLDSAGELSPEALGSVMSCVRRLGTDPEPLLRSRLPSPGETRKLMLCLGLLANPWLVIMDEPTNHLDLPGIECLEDALSELECALLLVSHDKRFLRSTTSGEWRIDPDGDSMRLTIFPPEEGKA